MGTKYAKIWSYCMFKKIQRTFQVLFIMIIFDEHPLF